MAKFDKETLERVKRLQNARLNLMRTQPFYALMLMHMKFAVDISCETAYTDGDRIAFNPEFIDNLNDKELEIVLLHEILHVVLKHCSRHRDSYDKRAFDLACDIVVNSNILYSNKMKIDSITLDKYGTLMHTTTEGKEGYLYSAEEVYEIILCEVQKAEEKGDESELFKKICGKNAKGNNDAGDWGDDHSFWQPDDSNDQKEIWQNRMVDATELLARMEENCDYNKSWGNLPAGVERMLKELKNPQTDWRTILNDFVQYEVNDYSFSPPDRRFSETDFFLPDYNEKEERVENILFMIDTSASMSDKMITQAYSEVKGAIDQFNGKLKGWLGFFDAKVVEPQPFESEEEFKVIRPVGGGGTSFTIIFDYLREMEDEVASVIILTDGYAPFPEEESANNVPVLWLINNEDVDPPWGKIARIKVDY